jgi:membrane dipeptidase
MTDWGVSERAAALHAEALVWDNHAGFEPEPDVDLNQLERWHDAGVDYLSVNVGYDRRPWQGTAVVLSAYRAWIKAHPEGFSLCATVDDVRRAKAEGKLGITFDIEGMDSLNEDLGLIEEYYRLGVRQMLFAYNLNNPAGGGCHDEDIGLTDFGRDVIAEMNRVGMLVDGSHSGYRTTMEAMEISSAPVIFSHANSRVLCDHERNIWDDQIKACAATGGMVGVTGIGIFLGDDGPTVDGLVRHIDYMAEMIGPDKVGIGLDFALDDEALTVGGDLNDDDHAYWPARQYGDGNIGFIDPAEFPRVTEALLARGYDDDQVRGILGENFLRVAGEVWKQPYDNN